MEERMQRLILGGFVLALSTIGACPAAVPVDTADDSRIAALEAQGLHITRVGKPFIKPRGITLEVPWEHQRANGGVDSFVGDDHNDPGHHDDNDLPGIGAFGGCGNRDHALGPADGNVDIDIDINIDNHNFGRNDEHEHYPAAKPDCECPRNDTRCGGRRDAGPSYGR